MLRSWKTLSVQSLKACLYAGALGPTLQASAVSLMCGRVLLQLLEDIISKGAHILIDCQLYLLSDGVQPSTVIKHYFLSQAFNGMELQRQNENLSKGNRLW
jgi:hypothetical protein